MSRCVLKERILVEERAIEVTGGLTWSDSLAGDINRFRLFRRCRRVLQCASAELWELIDDATSMRKEPDRS